VVPVSLIAKVYDPVAFNIPSLEGNGVHRLDFRWGPLTAKNSEKR